MIFLVGLYAVGATLYDRLYPAFTQNFRAPVDLRRRYGQGSWVLVSGATNELGRQFCHYFQQKGFNVLMVDSNGEQLQKLKEELTNEEGAKPEVQVLEFDLKGNNHWKDYEQLSKTIKSIT